MSTHALLKQPLTQDEHRVYGGIFRQLDTEGLGVVTGETARSTFEKSGLPPATLGEIWQLADPTNLGFLTQPSFCVALRVIAHVQQGHKPDAKLIEVAGPLANFNGTAAANVASPSITAPLPAINSTTTGSPQTIQPLTQQSTALPPLTNHDISKFSQLFAKNAPSGLINGTQARSIFLKAKLPTNVLGQIWALADRNNIGQLTRDEFVVAMYLIQGSISGAIQQLPQSLPQSVWDQVKLFQSPVITGASPSFSPQPTGGVRPATTRVPSSFNNASSDWVISPQKRAQFDGIFEGLDKNSTGVLGPGEVANFLMTSKLSQDTLASVWDLADIHNTGEFTKDEFAIAMFLVQKKIAGSELPDVVPDSLLPQSHPALQQQPTQSQPFTARPQIPSRDTKPNSSLNDLVELNEAFSSPATTPNVDSRNVSNATVNYTPTGSTAPRAFAPSSTFGQGLAKQNTSSSPIVAQTVVQPPASATQYRDVSQSSFAAQPTGQSPFPSAPTQIPSSTGSIFSTGSAAGLGALAGLAAGAGATLAGSAVATRGFSTKNDDLLADSNPEVSGKLSQATTDMANLSNQIGSLSSQTSQIHEKRTRAEKELAKITALKQDIESKLTKLRAAYDQEVRQTTQVESLLVSSRQETEQVRQEASVAEAQFNQVQSQLQQLQTELQESQNETLSLKERLAQLNVEQAEINKELERVRGEVKQSKGLVAINSKQLNVSEVQVSGIREEIENLLSSTRELDSHHETYTQKQAQLQVTQKQIEDYENALLARQQQYQQAEADFAAREQEQQNRVQQQQQYEQALDQEQQRLQQSFAELQERQRQHDAAEQQLQQQQVEYAQRIQQFTEKQIQDATGGFASHNISDDEDNNRDISTGEAAASGSVSKGIIAGAIGVAGAVGATAYAADSANSVTEEKNEEFDSPVAATTEKTASVTSDQYDQFPVAQPFDQLDIQRPESVTSSVQNNAPQSVRDDTEDTPNIDAIAEEPALAADVLGKDYNPSSTRAVGGAEPEGESSGVGSFEIVDDHKSESELTMGENTTAPDSTIADDADVIEQSLPGAWTVPTSTDVDETSPDIAETTTSESHDDVPKSTEAVPVTEKDEFDDLEPANEETVAQGSLTQDEEFPPIRELDIDESDSDEELFHETSEALSPVQAPAYPSGTYDASASPLVNAAAGLSGFSSTADPVAATPSVTHDAFADDFDGLEEAHEVGLQDDEDIEPQNFNEELEGTTFFGAGELHEAQSTFPTAASAGDVPTGQQGDEEWEQLFAGFGNQPTHVSQPQAIPAVQSRTTTGSSRAVPPRIATTPRSLAVQELTGMGFSQEEALKALEREKWNLEAATNFLLDNA